MPDTAIGLRHYVQELVAGALMSEANVPTNAARQSAADIVGRLIAAYVRPYVVITGIDMVIGAVLGLAAGFVIGRVT